MSRLSPPVSTSDVLLSEEVRLGTSGSELTPAPLGSLGPCLESSQSSRSPSSAISSCPPLLPTDTPNSVSSAPSFELNFSLAPPQYQGCVICGKQFSADRFRSHKKLCKRHRCLATGCGKCYSDAGSLKRHEKECRHIERNQPSSSYKCVCHKIFARWDKFVAHHRRRTCKALPGSSYVCQCGLALASIELFEAHHKTELRKAGRPRKQPRQEDNHEGEDYG